MKRIILSSLLSCILVGQAFGASTSEEPVPSLHQLCVRSLLQDRVEHPYPLNRHEPVCSLVNNAARRVKYVLKDAGRPLHESADVDGLTHDERILQEAERLSPLEDDSVSRDIANRKVYFAALAGLVTSVAIQGSAAYAYKHVERSKELLGAMGSAGGLIALGGMVGSFLIKRAEYSFNYDDQAPLTACESNEKKWKAFLGALVVPGIFGWFFGNYLSDFF